MIQQRCQTVAGSYKFPVRSGNPIRTDIIGRYQRAGKSEVRMWNNTILRIHVGQRIIALPCMGNRARYASVVLDFTTTHIILSGRKHAKIFIQTLGCCIYLLLCVQRFIVDEIYRVCLTHDVSLINSDVIWSKIIGRLIKIQARLQGHEPCSKCCYCNILYSFHCLNDCLEC